MTRFVLGVFLVLVGVSVFFRHGIHTPLYGFFSFGMAATPIGASVIVVGFYFVCSAISKKDGF